jgi:N-acetylmuramoyl-L-alanine amidase
MIAFVLLAAVAAKPTQVIFLDPGHGTPGNEGATTALCEKEQDVVLAIAAALKTSLEATGHFSVVLARTSSAGPAYGERVRAAERAKADAFISVHLDARGEAHAHTCSDGQVTMRNDSEGGFAVLRSDRGRFGLVAKRKRLARALARNLAEAGFSAYDGEDYGGLYERDPVPGVFVDRRGLFMLRAPKIPSVIVETHHGLFLEEAERWRERATLDAFGRAVGAALVEFLAG